MSAVIIDLPDLAATERLAARVAAMARTGDVILLAGELGAGKTAFARACLRVLCADPALEVPSPSFTLVQEYDTPRGKVSHFDLWRIEGPEALAELGWEDARGGLVVVEWPERLGPLCPLESLRIEMVLGEGDARRAIMTGWRGRLERFA